MNRSVSLRASGAGTRGARAAQALVSGTGDCREYRRNEREETLWGPMTSAVLVIRIEVEEGNARIAAGTYEYLVRVAKLSLARLEEHLLRVLDALTPEDRDFRRVDGERWGIPSGFNPEHEGYHLHDTYRVVLRWPRSR